MYETRVKLQFEQQVRIAKHVFWEICFDEEYRENIKLNICWRLNAYCY